MVGLRPRSRVLIGALALVVAAGARASWPEDEVDVRTMAENSRNPIEWFGSEETN